MACGCGCGCNGNGEAESWYSGGSGGGSGGGSAATAAGEESPGFQVAGLSWWVWLLIVSAAYSIYNYQG